MGSKKQTLHVISATHWDREWIVPFEAYRAEFVAFTDRMIRIMEADPAFAHYQLDGQVICIEDYLAIRPEQTEKIRQLVKAGRLMIGPWYTLPDMNLNCGEAIVRNLLTGIRAADELGGAMMEGYTACSNGQIAQLPQIYAGFGIESAVIYKGIWEDRFPREIVWRSPDGSEVLALCLSARYGRAEFYCLLFHEVIANVIHDDPDNDTWEYAIGEDHFPFRVDGQRYHNPSVYECLNKHEGFYREHLEPYLKKLRDWAGKRAATSQLVAFHGMDHTPPFAATPRLIAAANERFDDLEVVDSSLPEAMAAIRRELGRSALPLHEGELRDVRRGGHDRNANIATLSARMDVKIANRETEHALIDRAEPLSVWAWLGGDEYPAALLQHGWKLLLANHGHDSIDGCSMDKVNSDVLTRFTDCQTLCETLTQKALGFLMANAERAPEGKEASVAPFVVVFNPGLRPQNGSCEMMIDLPKGDGDDHLVLIDSSGKEIVPQLGESFDWSAATKGTVGRPMSATRRRAVFEVADVPAMGWRALRIAGAASPEAETRDLSPEANVLENDHVRVRIRDDGRLDMLCKATGREHNGGHYFVDRGDVGDPWNFTPRDGEPVTSIGLPAEIELVENGPVRAAYRVRVVLLVPASGLLSDDAKRSERCELTITSTISLARSSRYVEVATTIDNRSKYHKLTVCFPTGLTCKSTYAGGQYDVMERPTALPDMTGWREPITGYPNYGFAGLSDGKAGFSLLNIGLPEYFVEAGADGQTLTLTLLRAVQLTHGWPTDHPSVEQGNVLGETTCRYALYPHAGGWREAELWQTDREYAAPVICAQYFGHALSTAGTRMIELDSDILQVSCVKRAEDGKGLIVRLWNPLAQAVTGNIRTAFAVQAASYVDFNEASLDGRVIGLSLTDQNTLTFRAGGKQVVSVRMELKGGMG